jgi:hypothetical protein
MSAGTIEIVFPVLPITALTNAFIGCIVVITPFVSAAKTLLIDKKTKIIKVRSLFISFPLKVLIAML